MTRKDYVMIAAAIRETLLTDPKTGIAPPDREAAATHRVARRLADQLHSENTRFDRTRFIEACGLTA
jgi:hypothetical protein